jgi:hypothetical protein
MKRTKKIRKAIVTAVCLASLLLSVETAFATNPVLATVTFQVIPGIGGSNNAGTSGTVYFNCGWHSSCKSPYPSGTGVDWGSGTGAASNVYLRAKVFHNLSATARKTFIAKVYASTFSGGCHRIVAEIWAVERNLDSSTDDTHVMNLIFMHSSPTTTGTVTYTFNGTQAGLVQGFAIGKTVSDLNAGTCGWTGYHLHSDQESVGGIAITRNTTDIPNAAPACPGDSGACNTFKTGGTSWSPPANHWERKVGWVFCYANCSNY